MAARRRTSAPLVAEYRPPSLHERMSSDADMMAHSMAREHPLMKQLHKDMKRAIMSAGKKAMRSAGKGSRVRRVRSS